MKKLTLFILNIFLLFTLSSCVITIKEELSLGDNIDNITTIDIYYETSEEEHISIDIVDFKENKEIYYSISSEEIEDFINNLLNLEYKRKAIFPLPIDYAHLFYPGYIVFINYNSEGTDVFAKKGIYTHTFNSEGKVYYNYNNASCQGDNTWETFIESYVII